MTDAAAFADFVRLNTPTLSRTAYLLTGDRVRAEELLQDTLTRLYPKWARVSAADSALAYVRRSLANRFISGARRPDSRVSPVWQPAQLAAAPDPAESVADRVLVGQLLAALPARQRAAVVLRYFNDLADADIAAALDCRPATVRSLISRGTAAMRAHQERMRDADLLRRSKS